ncbi:MAG: 2-amino-4-hydroxy-6-hydroxymethyldihydropteridine diphosphokinase [Pelotomaculum sp.]|uniref:2-amino-4-hydroxy-6-hydroxymethyldihydropteridine diphosphokinase n=1 Tax=Pelotomaculum thermopropionicum (strain DSM 13744 / JCM 10971 / SI) TaxID=370438 RepID=A5D5V5_PELTS|nr:2-amino-4-hydroxy-6-hydroxymethyldihydropteridine diphosphokinase [Pelotomaculum sp.]BAF58387.1 7,8-dihydro-6-hydroxymethylpterin-pyrophosphokinase [Pelotomaculum thermopropionicum SI]
MLRTAYIGLGSNMGDKKANIERALEMLKASAGVRVKRVASLYRTAPLGYTRQDWFLNTVAEVETGLGPHELLALLLDIERRLGRVRTVRWGPRLIDLDLLVYGDEEIDTPALTVPHPRMGERAFVMVPLAELVPDLTVPGRGRAAELAEKLAGEQKICRFAVN